MKKSIGFKAKLFGLAILSAGAATTLPALAPQITMAQEADTSDKTNDMYEIVRKINIFYKNNDGSVTKGKPLSQKGYVSNKSMKFTFKELKVKDLFGGNLGNWKPDRETIPSVTATFNNPPADVSIYLSQDTSKTVEESRTIKRTIKYFIQDENGKKSPAGSKSNSVTFMRYVRITTDGKKVKTPWSGTHTFESVTVPAKSGYTPNIKTVPAKTVKPTDSDIVVEVIYKKNSSKKTSKNGWYKENGGFKYYKNGVAYKGWHKMGKAEGEKQEHWSYFGNDGKIYTGWHKMGKTEGETKEHWSYFGDNGWLRTNWQQMGKGTNNPDGNNARHWSYFGPNGWLRTGIQEMGKGTSNPDGNAAKHKSYFGNNGWLVVNRKFTLSGKIYIADNRGWLK